MPRCILSRHSSVGTERQQRTSYSRPSPSSPGTSDRSRTGPRWPVGRGCSLHPGSKTSLAAWKWWTPRVVWGIPQTSDPMGWWFCLRIPPTENPQSRSRWKALAAIVLGDQEYFTAFSNLRKWKQASYYSQEKRSRKRIPLLLDTRDLEKEKGAYASDLLTLLRFLNVVARKTNTSISSMMKLLQRV